MSKFWVTYRVLPNRLERSIEEEDEDSDLGKVVEGVDELHAPQLRLAAHHRDDVLANGRT